MSWDLCSTSLRVMVIHTTCSEEKSSHKQWAKTLDGGSSVSWTGKCGAGQSVWLLEWQNCGTPESQMFYSLPGLEILTLHFLPFQP